VRAGSAPNPLLLPAVEDNLDGASAAEIARSLRRRVDDGDYRPSPAVLVPVPKVSGLPRLAALMTLDDRAVYAALVAKVAPTLEASAGAQPPIDPKASDAWLRAGKRDWRASMAGAKFLLQADVADYGGSLSRARLLDTLPGLGAPAAVTEALGRLLDTVLAGAPGLPPGPSASDFLAGVFLAPVDRAMRERHGRAYHRAKDDFYVAVDTVDAGDRALHDLEAAVAELGLRLNPAKTRADTFVSDDEREAEPWRPRGSAFQRRLARLGPAAPARAAAAFLADLPAEPAPHRGVVRRALAALRLARSPLGLPHVEAVLLRYPVITPEVGRYVAVVLASRHASAASDTVEAVVTGRRLAYAWQDAWLLRAMHTNPARVTPGLTNSLAGLAADDEWVRVVEALRLQAAVGDQVEDVLEETWERAPAPLHPALLAIGAASGLGPFLALHADDPLAGIVTARRGRVGLAMPAPA
jgi:hypothetical protein